MRRIPLFLLDLFYLQCQCQRRRSLNKVCSCCHCFCCCCFHHLAQQSVNSAFEGRRLAGFQAMVHRQCHLMRTPKQNLLSLLIPFMALHRRPLRLPLGLPVPDALPHGHCGIRHLPKELRLRADVLQGRSSSIQYHNNKNRLSSKTCGNDKIFK